jgi:hypothetical protein
MLCKLLLVRKFSTRLGIWNDKSRFWKVTADSRVVCNSVGFTDGAGGGSLKSPGLSEVPTWLENLASLVHRLYLMD